MSLTNTLNELTQAGIIPAEQHDKIAEHEQKKPFSLHWELRSLLYAGILLLSSGLGLLIYDNFDQIGHGALLAGITAACAASFFFAWRNRPAWAITQTRSRSTFGDYALLLGCLLFLTLEGYAQYAYNVFGERYGLVTLLPALLFLPLAYRFNHRGVLGMALTALISWVGVTVRPLELYFKTNFFNQATVFSVIGLSLLVLGVALWLDRRRIKPHFTETYMTVMGNVLGVALLGGLFNFAELRLWFALGLAVACVTFDFHGRQQRSYLFLLMGTVYGYIGATYLFFHYLPDNLNSIADIYYYYFIFTGIALVYYLLRNLPRNRVTS